MDHRHTSLYFKKTILFYITIVALKLVLIILLLQDFTDLYAQLGLRIYAFSLSSTIKCNHNHILLQWAIHFFTGYVVLTHKPWRYINLSFTYHFALCTRWAILQVKMICIAQQII